MAINVPRNGANATDQRKKAERVEYLPAMQTNICEIVTGLFDRNKETGISTAVGVDSSVNLFARPFADAGQ